MSTTYLDKGKQPLLPKNALITPSASPPAFSPSDPRFRRKSTSRPPPPKRVRTSSTPSTPGPSESNAPSSSASSSVAQALDTNRDEAWRASSQRLMDVWSQLAERYNIPLDKDDIIDIRTAKLVKDRGVTRRSKRVYRIGYFGDPSSDDGNEEREEDDEIDIVSRPEPEVPIKLEMEKSNRVLSPFTEMNPEDADDLRSFLEEEERRKAVGGVDDEEDEDEIGVETLLAEDLDSDSVEILSQEEDEGSDWVTDDNGEEVRRVKKIIVGTTQRALTPVDSEDEFARWDPDDAAPIHTTPRPPPPRERSPDMIDLTTPSPPSSRDLPSSRGWSPSRTQTDLRSPPSSPLRSEASTSQTHAGNGRVSQPPSIKPSALFQSLARNSQLQTPPTSSSSNSTPDILEVAERAVSRSPSPPPPRRHPSIRPKASNPTLSASASRTLQTPPPRSPPLPRQSEFVRPATPHKVISRRVRDATPGPLTGRVPEVVITRRASRPSATPVKTRMEPTGANGIEQKRSLVSTPRQQNSVDKGKGVAIAQDFDSSDDEPLPPPRRRAKSLAPPESREPSFTERTSTLTVSSSPARHPKAIKPSNVSLPPNGAHKRKRSTTPVSAGSSSDEKPLVKTSGSSRHATSKPPLRPALRTNKHNGKARQEVADARPATANPRARSRSRPRASSTPPSPTESHTQPYTPWTMPATPHHNSHHSRSRSRAPPMQYPPPLPPLQDIAQALQYLSYLFPSGAAPPGYPPPYPPHYGQSQSATAFPQTPKRQHRSSRREASSSPDAGTSSSTVSFGYNTPSHRVHPYPFTFDPAWSSATEPPESSSPIPSPASSPAPSTSSHHRARSKSQGRRVSFRLDPKDRPSVRSKSAVAEREEDEEDEDEDDLRLRNDEQTSSSSRKGKTQQSRSRVRQDYSSGDDDPARPGAKTPTERGRTPGPVSRREGRVSMHRK